MRDLERVGGKEGVSRIMTEFIHRVSEDFIIGFLFQGRDLSRIIRHETELAVQHLSGEGTYTGRPMARVHRPLKINRGQFRRRLAILRVVLQANQVPKEICERWLEHNQKMERIVTDGTDCGPPSSFES